MKITVSQKITAGILVLALGAFGYDRVCGSKESDQPAGDGSPLLLATTSTSIASTDKPAAEAASFSERLTKASSELNATSPEAIRDVFHPVEGWMTKPVVVVVPEAPAATDKFVQSHRLSAVTTNAQGGAALIDGKLLRVGATVDGFRLISISRQSATFSAGGAQVELLIAKDSVAGGR